MSKIKYELDGKLAVITFCDPPLNLIEENIGAEISAILDRMEKDAPRGMLMKVDEGNFSAGADVNIFKGVTPEKAAKHFGDFVKVIHRIENLPYPTMAAVRGMCLTAGLEIVLACDFIWAADSAMLGQVEASIGVFPLAGGGQRIAIRAGVARAKEIVFGARLYPAKTFEQWNIVNRVLPDADVNEKAIAFMKNMANNGATIAISSAKKTINTYAQQGLEPADKVMITFAGPIFASEDIKTGIDSLLKEGPGKAKFSGK